MVKEVLSFDDVMLPPSYSEVPSRALVDTSVELTTNSQKTYKLQIPIVSSPMDTVSESEMIFRLWTVGGMGIFHRYCTLEYQENMLQRAWNSFYDFKEKNSDELTSDTQPFIREFIFGGAIGVTGDYIERAKMLIANGARAICIDVAHGHHKNVKLALERLWKDIDLSNIHVMAGNVGPKEGFEYLASTGLVNSVRCGLSGGSICSTYMATGFGYPTLQSVLEAQDYLIENSNCSVQIVADGGIRASKDVNIAIAAGAQLVMLGSMLAGTKATPGEKINQDNRDWKKYRGGASYESQKARGIANPRVEGVSTLVPYKGKIENIIQPIKDGLQSGISYVGALNIPDFQIKVNLVKITQAAYIQGTPHILRGR